MILSPRLLKIAQCINCDILADIGTDHGYIPIFSVNNELCKKAIACDINVGPLISAKENIELYNLNGKIETRLSNGLEALSPMEADTIVIAGMGGLLIRDILIQGAEKIGDETNLILQPMVAVDQLREFLLNNGFDILKEHLAREGDKFYNILCIKKGECEYTQKEILFGKGLEQDENYTDYMNFHKNVIEKIINGLKKSSNKKDEAEYYKKILDMI